VIRTLALVSLPPAETATMWSIFGCLHEGSTTALLLVYTTYTTTRPEPAWTVMPRVESPAEHWPDFTDGPLFGHWFWEYYQAGTIISVGNLIAPNPNTVFWTATEEILGSDCCTVARDIRSLAGPVLRHGRYVDFDVLRAGKSVPPLGALLAETEKTDLSSPVSVLGPVIRQPHFMIRRRRGRAADSSQPPALACSAARGPVVLVVAFAGGGNAPT
jgi:hypothetical protein